MLEAPTYNRVPGERSGSLRRAVISTLHRPLILGIEFAMSSGMARGIDGVKSGSR
jgi:hypothetical protein